MPNLNDKQLHDIANTPLGELVEQQKEAKSEPFAAASEQFRKLVAVPIEERIFYEMDPLWKWVSVRKVDREVTSYGETKIVGAIDASRSQVGVIEAISDLCVQKKIQIGDRVMFTNYVLMLPDIEESTGRKDLFLVREEEIYCILKPKPRPAPIAPTESELYQACGPEEAAAPEPVSVEAV